MKAAAWLIVASMLLGGGWALNKHAPTDPKAPAASLTYTPAPRDDERDIRQFGNAYYGALRLGEYERAAAMYEPGSLAVLPIAPAKALKLLVDLDGGVPADVRLEAIRVNGDLATAEVVTRTPRPIGGNLGLRDSAGNNLGTWAQTIHLKRINGKWMLTEPTDDSTQAQIRALRSLSGK